MDVRAESCPVCLRKRTRQEIFAGLRGERPAKPGAAGGRLRMLVYVSLGAAGIGYAAQRWPAVVRSLTAPPKRVQWERPAVAPPAPDPMTAPVDEAGVPSSPSPPTLGTPPGPQAPGPSRLWAVRGKVFDLMTLAPVPGAELRFQDTSSGEVLRARSGADGTYQVSLPKRDGAAYRVSVAKRGFLDDYLEDSEPSFLARDAAARRAAAGEMEVSAVLHVPLSPPLEDDSVEMNYALVPLERRRRK